MFKVQIQNKDILDGVWWFSWIISTLISQLIGNSFPGWKLRRAWKWAKLVKEMQYCVAIARVFATVPAKKLRFPHVKLVSWWKAGVLRPLGHQHEWGKNEPLNQYARRDMEITNFSVRHMQEQWKIWLNVPILFVEHIMQRSKMFEYYYIPPTTTNLYSVIRK